MDDEFVAGLDIPGGADEPMLPDERDGAVASPHHSHDVRASLNAILEAKTKTGEEGKAAYLSDGRRREDEGAPASALVVDDEFVAGLAADVSRPSPEAVAVLEDEGSSGGARLEI